MVCLDIIAARTCWCDSRNWGYICTGVYSATYKEIGLEGWQIDGLNYHSYISLLE